VPFLGNISRSDEAAGIGFRCHEHHTIMWHRHIKWEVCGSSFPC
jgi:hypothetical protein